jgi:hypothetical protein
LRRTVLPGAGRLNAITRRTDPLVLWAAAGITDAVRGNHGTQVLADVPCRSRLMNVAVGDLLNCGGMLT